MWILALILSCDICTVGEFGATIKLKSEVVFEEFISKRKVCFPPIHPVKGK